MNETDRQIVRMAMAAELESLIRPTYHNPCDWLADLMTCPADIARWRAWVDRTESARETLEIRLSLRALDFRILSDGNGGFRAPKNEAERDLVRRKVLNFSSEYRDLVDLSQMASRGLEFMRNRLAVLSLGVKQLIVEAKHELPG